MGAFLFCNNFLSAQDVAPVDGAYESIQGTELAYSSLSNAIEIPIAEENSPTEIDSVSRTDKDECEVEEELKEAFPAPLACSISGDYHYL